MHTPVSGSHSRHWVVSALCLALLVLGLAFWASRTDAPIGIDEASRMPPATDADPSLPESADSLSTWRELAAGGEVPDAPEAPADEDAISGPEAASSIPPENDPQRLFEVACQLLNREDFVRQLVESSVLAEMPTAVVVDAGLADKAYWSVVHVLAGQMYVHRPEVMKNDPALARRAMPDKVRTDILQSLMPDLPALVRDEKIQLRLVNEGGAEELHGNIKTGFTGMRVDQHHLRMQITMQHGPWAVKLVIPKEVVAPELWQAWVQAWRDK